MMVDSVPGEGGIALHNSYPMERPKTSHGRPKTGHGRRRSEADEPNVAPSEVPPSVEADIPPRPTTSRANRPRTSHGRRPPDQQQLMQQHQQRYIDQEQEQYEQQQQQHYHHQRQPPQQQHQQHHQQQHYAQDEYPIERPKTSHGRRRSSVQLLRQDSSPSPHVMTPERDSQQSPFRTPSSMRPMTGSTMSHYAILPPIGAKAEQPPPPPSPPRLGERSVTMLNLKNDVQIMKLEDDSDNNEDRALSPAMGEKERSNLGEKETSTLGERQKTKSPSVRTDTDRLVLQKEGTSMSGGKPASEEPPPFRPLTRENTLSKEPTAEEDKETIMLAVKLPDGQRVSRRFRRDETMGMVMHFAEVSSQLDLSGYDLVCDAPRKVYKDLNITVGESGLATRTVLHIRFPDNDSPVDNRK